MAKAAPVHFSCAECGYSTGRWLGRCPGCGSFGTLAEEAAAAANGSAQPKPLLRLAEVEVDEAQRIETGVPELDRVLGGGLVPASLVLVGGEPGVGKSTLLLMALASISRERRALLVTGEESTAQVKLRAARLGGAEKVEILAETNLDAVCATLESERPDVCVIDSIQTLYSADVGSAPGSVAQVREAAARLLRVGKEAGVALFLVGHVTKDGSVVGPSEGEVGAAVACALEGTRPILLEIQALVSQTDLAMPRRVGTGVDPKRLAMIVAVLSRHAGLALGQADVFVNVAGGLRIDEPGADLPVALAIASAARGVALTPSTASFGEIGLTGRLRPAAQSERRLEECAKLGVVAAIAPEGTRSRSKIHISGSGTLRDAL